MNFRLSCNNQILQTALFLVFAVPTVSFASTQDLLDLPMINLKSALQAEQGLQSSAIGFWKVADSKNENWVKRWKALIAAGKIEGNKSSQKLKSYSKDSNWFMRSGSMVSAAQFDLNLAKEIARILIADKALMVRSQAVHILSTSLEASDRSLLWEELKEKRNFRGGQSLWLRSQILSTLSLEPKKEEASQWKNLSSEKDAKIKVLVSKASQQIGLF